MNNQVKVIVDFPGGSLTEQQESVIRNFINNKTKFIKPGSDVYHFEALLYDEINLRDTILGINLLKNRVGMKIIFQYEAENYANDYTYISDGKKFILQVYI